MKQIDSITEGKAEFLKVLKKLISPLGGRISNDSSIIEWASPIVSFGDLGTASLATLGLNPSNLEYVDYEGAELSGSTRRFHTLKSLGLKNWSEIDETNFDHILEKCSYYFRNNPYDNWFKKLDYLISGSKHSYYFPSSNACHLDLVPYATREKWGELPVSEKEMLLEISADALGNILKYSKIKVLILNGRSVIEGLKDISQSSFKEVPMPSWNLPRKVKSDVLGYAYEGFIGQIGNVTIGREIRILGFNHNIQSSFGVTNQVQTEIRNWIKDNLNNE